MDAGEIRSADRLRKPGPPDAGTHAARTRAEHLRHCLEEEILHTVESRDDLDGENRHLLGLFR